MLAVGCLAAALGILALSTASSATAPFAWTAIGYLIAGAGFCVLTPAAAHLAIRDVPTGASGAASGVLNSSRQVDTSVGLAVLGAIGINAAISDWCAKTGRFPASVRARALDQVQNVSGARISAVTHSLGSACRHPAADSFVHGYHLTVLAGAACLLLAALLAAIGFRRHPSGPAQPDDALPSRSHRSLCEHRSSAYGVLGGLEAMTDLARS
ncbi:MAG: hypothetical protein DLM62_10110 [Pseudonocardiales bacterium]|nr:MAG: hypothetical protein DLM62_10110 [Pseudonocardiales bacterium]